MSTIDHVKQPDADNPLFSARTTLPLPASASISFHDPERRQWGDVVLTPTLAVPPFPLHIQGVEKIDGHIVQPFQWLAFTFPLNMTGQPAATIRRGFIYPILFSIAYVYLMFPLASGEEKIRPFPESFACMINFLDMHLMMPEGLRCME